MAGIFDLLIANKTGGGAAVLQLLQDDRLAAQQKAGETERAQVKAEEAAALKPVLGQFGAETAQQVGGLLTSGIPAAESVGAQQLNDLLDQRSKVPQGGAGIGTPSPKDFTQDSLAEFQQTGDPRSLVRYTDPLALQRANMSQDRLALQQLQAARPSPAQLEKIIADQQSLDSLDSIVNLSDASFFGMGLDTVADARREYSRRFGGEEEAKFLDFWREYDTWILNIRKEKFGTQFTPTEQRVFDRLVAKPSDTYSTSMSNIQQQRGIVNRARMRRRSVLEDLGMTVPDRRPAGQTQKAEEADEPIEVFGSGAR